MILRTKKAFTLLEVVVVVPIAMAVLLMINAVFLNGMRLYVKNTSVNVAHHEARIATARLVRDIHSSISVPQLIDAQRNKVLVQPLQGSKPSGVAGISFQLVAGGPFNLKNDPGNKNLIQFEMPGFTPKVGQRLILPHYEIEDDIVKVSSNGANHYNLWLAGAQEARIKEKAGSFILSYVTRRCSYVVQPDPQNPGYYMLCFYPEASGPYVVVAKHVTSPTPFSIPVRPPAQTEDTRYIGVKLTTADPRYSNRELRSVNTLIETEIPYRAKLTKYK